MASFSRAAQQLCVTQAAVSRAVQRLEQQLECQLFERTAGGVISTAHGRSFRALIESHVTGLEAATSAFEAQNRTNKASKHVLRVSVVTTLGTRWLMPRLPKFQQENPNIKIELRQYHPDENFSRTDVDMWIDVKRLTEWPRGYRAEYLLGKEISPACTPTIAARLNSVQDILKETLLYHIDFPKNWETWLRGVGVPNAAPALGTGLDLGSNLIVAASAGMGVIVLQPCLMENELKTGELVMPFKQLVSINRGYYACYSAALAENASIRRFVAWLHQQAKASGLIK